MKPKKQDWDVIVGGAGMGGLSAGALLASQGYSVLVLEAAAVPGGCSSSFTRKGYTFESGATTLIGFDEHQPLRFLEDRLQIDIPKWKIDPPMRVILDEAELVRFQNIERWIDEASRVFGNAKGQKRFWKLLYNISQVVWRVSGVQHHFPPSSIGDWIKTVTAANPLDAWILAFSKVSTHSMARHFGLDTPDFMRFLDEQLMITAQAPARQVPFLFAAPALTYTNYSNYYVPGGLLEMARTVERRIEELDGQLACNQRITDIRFENHQAIVQTHKGEELKAKAFVSNLPIWNTLDLIGEIRNRVQIPEKKPPQAWGAFTMGMVVEDLIPQHWPLHHQIHLDQPLVHTNSDSIFISVSHPEDQRRTPQGKRVLNISTHTKTAPWFSMNGTYDQAKQDTASAIEALVREKFLRKKDADIYESFASTPVTWQNWVYRKHGQVGGIPQSMNRSLLDWKRNFEKGLPLFHCGDTTYPGQGIPGVTLSGINVYYRVKSFLEKSTPQFV